MVSAVAYATQLQSGKTIAGNSYRCWKKQVVHLAMGSCTGGQGFVPFIVVRRTAEEAGRTSFVEVD